MKKRESSRSPFPNIHFNKTNHYYIQNILSLNLSESVSVSDIAKIEEEFDLRNPLKW